MVFWLLLGRRFRRCRVLVCRGETDSAGSDAMSLADATGALTSGRENRTKRPDDSLQLFLSSEAVDDAGGQPKTGSGLVTCTSLALFGVAGVAGSRPSSMTSADLGRGS